MSKKINKKIDGSFGQTGTVKGESGKGTRKMTAKEISSLAALIQSIGTHKQKGFIMVLTSTDIDDSVKVEGTILNNKMSQKHIIDTFIKSLGVNPIALLSSIIQ